MGIEPIPRDRQSRILATRPMYQKIKRFFINCTNSIPVIFYFFCCKSLCVNFLHKAKNRRAVTPNALRAVIDIERMCAGT